ncbi:nonribosomal peptide synthetase 12 [Aspergillus udagawae]|uniref:Nonribosomal peptide synthetase 12 n=1 Tax=Aspergillus udagawae TaxID=91492 RepID=A0ABQ1AMR0_9EURO|nr:nonribosomal peptide synthetase 12 [Aspergillus udagawae]
MTTIGASPPRAAGDGVCLFPTINNANLSAIDQEIKTISFDPCVIRKIKTSGYEVHWILCTAWAIVLSRYVEADRIRFGLDTSAGRHICRVTLDTETQADSLLRGNGLDLPIWSKGEAGTINTGVCIQDQPESCDDLKQLYDVNIVGQFCGSHPILQLVYRRHLLAPFYAKNLANTVGHALESILEEPTRRVIQISLCCPIQRERILTWQKSSILHEAMHSTIYRLVKEWAVQRPNAQAIEDTDGSFTYAELDELSSRLAAYLADKHDVRSGTVVMLCAAKSRWVIVAMLAINKAGGCFVPCDPDYPASRQHAMAAMCGSRIAVVSAGYEHAFDGLVNETVVISAATVYAWLAPPREFMTIPTAPAYCFFTSGSTGEPKGCIGSHSALAAVAHQVPALLLSPESRVLQFARLGFGISFIEIFCTLAAGGVVCMPSSQERMNALSDAMNRMKVNWALLTPTMAESLDPSSLKTLDKLFLGGETPSEAQVLKWASKVALFQVYGTTEMAGITCVSQQITSPQARRTVGSPVNSRVWLVDVDRYDRLAPIGAVAELLIEGQSLADGYLGDSERSDASFISDPPWMRVSELEPTMRRVYKTGDLVRYNEDGSLSLVGRKGTRVKLRGQRLELEEVECQLALVLQDSESLSNVQRVVATIIEPEILVAVLVIPIDHPISSNGLQFHPIDAGQMLSDLKHVQMKLSSLLPTFMVPQLLLALTDLPKGATGKVDRRTLQRQLSAIPFEELGRLAGVRMQAEPPGSDAALTIHSLVCDVLKLSPDTVGMRDNFFHLGGNSILAIKMVAAAKRLSVQLSVADIFDHPVLADLASVVGPVSYPCPLTLDSFALVQPSVSCEKDLRQAVASQLNVDPAIIQDAYPCTPLQEGLMALTEKCPSSYRCRVVCQLEDSVQIGAFKAAWETVVAQNDILRTRIALAPSQKLIQVVIREPFVWDVAQHRMDYLAQTEQAVMGVRTRLVHGCILDNEPAGAVFILTIHHVLCDRWSIRSMLEQVQSIYKNHHVVQQNAFTPFIQYIQQQSPGSDDYWSTRFTNLEAQVFPPLPQPDYTPVANGELRHELCLPPRVARIYTLPSYIRLAWALAIAHNTAVNDVVFGETLSGRNARLNNGHDIAQVAGPTIATVPQRLRLDMTKSVDEILAELQEQVAHMSPYEQTGLQQIRRVSPEAEIACLFQSHLVIQSAANFPKDIFRSVQGTSVSIGGFLSYALALECCLTEDEGHLTTVAGFDSRVLCEARVERLLSHFEMVLRCLLQDPYQRLSDVPSVGPADLDQIYSWNASVAEPSQQIIHEVIRQRAQEAPSDPAMWSWDGEFSYQELEKRSNQVAMNLVGLRVQPGSFVAILFEKSKWTTVAMLGVSKAGAAFVLMDPGQPRQRLSTIARESQSTLILCSETTRNLAKEIIAAYLVVGDDTVDIWNCVVDLARLPQVTPQDAAYAVFTSGSTGTPKGTIIEHSSYCTSAKEFTACQLVDKHSRMLQFASYSFDCCIGESISTLMVGGCVCIISDHDRQNALARAARDAKVTNAMLTPSVARLLRHEDIPSLRVLSLMGEAMRPADYDYWAERVVLINGYGPTECSVGISYQQYRPGVHVRDIGRPRAAAAWVTDPRDHNRLMPVGAVGELLLEGDPVARGYMNNPEQTTEAFPETPSWLQGIRKTRYRIYKTGDLVHYNEDGSLRIVGRANDQIKVRGQRLEKAEVETQLRNCWEWLPGSQPGEVAVDAVMPLGNADRVCLGAFVVVHGETQESQDVWAAPDAEFCRRATDAETQLQRQLPHFMVPSIFVPLTRMPRMASGKIDRPLLKRRIQSMSEDELRTFFTAVASSHLPISPEEEFLRELWAQVLGLPVERVGVDDNFFRLGGDSIAGMQVVLQARARQRVYTLADIFQYKTIKALVEHTAISKSDTSHSAAAVPDKQWSDVEARKKLLADAGIAGQDVEDAYLCAPIQCGMLLVQARSPAFYHVAFTWEVLNESVETVTSAIQQVIARHAIFRSYFLEPSFVGSDQAKPSFIQVVERYKAREIRTRSAAELDSFPGDFQPSLRDPSRFTIYHDGSRVWVRLDITHALWDGITSLVVEHDLGLACQNQLPLRPPPSFQSYISYIQNRDKAAAFAFWEAQLAQFQPCYFPALTSNQTHDQKLSQCRRFEINDHAAIATYCRQYHITAPNLFCMAWALVLRAFTGLDAVCFGSIVSGRHIPLEGIAEMTGPLINCLPVRVDLNRGTVAQVLQQVSSDYGAGIAHQTCPVAEINHHTGRSPMALFNTQISIRRQEPAETEVKFHTRLRSIQSPEPQERLVSVYVVIEEQRTRVELWHWESSISSEQAAIIETCFRSAVSQILHNAEQPATSLDVLTTEQKAVIWSSSLISIATRVCRMQEIWAGVLNRSPGDVSPDDQFFRLGGDSMKAMTVVGLARREGMDIRMEDVLNDYSLVTLVERSVRHQLDTLCE